MTLKTHLVSVPKRIAPVDRTVSRAAVMFDRLGAEIGGIGEPIMIPNSGPPDAQN
jgi:hypothetical protein